MLKPRPLRAIAALIAFATISFFGIYWWQLVQSGDLLRHETLAAAELRASQLADAMSRRLDANIGAIDLALRQLRDDYAEGKEADFRVTVRNVLDTFQQGSLRQVTVIDAEGYLAYSSSGMNQGVYLGDREHFRAQASSREDRIYISKPSFGRLNQSWSIFFTRKILKKGHFAGEVVIAISPDYIAKNLIDLTLSPKDAISVFDFDGNYLARSRDLEGALGKSLTEKRPFMGKDIAKRGVFRAPANFDRVHRIYAWQRLENAPLSINIGLDEQTVLAPVEDAIRRSWRLNAIGSGLILLLVAGTVLLLLRVSRQQQELAERAERNRLITDPGGMIQEVNPAFTRLTGYERFEVIGKSPSLLSSGRQDEEFYAKLWRSLKSEGHWHGDLWNRKKNGEIYVESLTISAIKNEDDITTAYVGIFSDITSIKEGQELLASLAYHDALTKLPNRILLTDRMEQAISLASRRDYLVAVCYLDLDGFKPVNDTYGHQVGDLLLVEVARRLSESVRATDTVCRLGGDEFVLLLTSLTTVGELEEVLSRLAKSVSSPYRIGDNEAATVTASIGVTLYPLDSEDPETLLHHADQAMYAAKRSGANRICYYEPGME